MIPDKLLILNYHKIESKKDIGITTRHPEDFNNDLYDLKEMGYETITFQNILKNNLPEKPVMITFDDGYESFFHKGFEQLQKFNMKAVVYIPAEYIGKINDWDVQLAGKKYQHMSADQLKEISSADMEVASHGMSHRYLNSFSDKEIDFELEESKKKIEKITGVNVLSISYPFGKYNARVIEQAKKFYQFGVALAGLSNGQFNPMALPRINIYRIDSRKNFRDKLEYFNNKSVLFKNWIIRQGGWATIGLQKIKMV